MTHTADETWRQVRWEQQGVNRGIERYRRAAATADPTTLPPGQYLLRSTVGALSSAILAAQAEGRDAAVNVKGRPVVWHGMIQLLDAERIAMIVASTLLRRTAMIETPLVGTARVIAKTIKDQVEMSRWEDSMMDQREKGRWDDLATFRTRYPNADRRVWRTWSKRLEGLQTEDWSPSQETLFGAHLVNLAVSTCPDWFAMKDEWVHGKSTRFVTITDRSQEIMQDITARSELANPARLPMIVPPLPWRYEPAIEPNDHTERTAPCYPNRPLHESSHRSTDVRSGRGSPEAGLTDTTTTTAVRPEWFGLPG